MIGVSATANAVAGLSLLTDLQKHLDQKASSGFGDLSEYRFRLEVAGGAMDVAIHQGHWDPALISSLIEARAWINYGLIHLDDPSWLWAHFLENMEERGALEDRLRQMGKALFLMI